MFIQVYVCMYARLDLHMTICWPKVEKCRLQQSVVRALIANCIFLQVGRDERSMIAMKIQAEFTQSCVSETATVKRATSTCLCSPMTEFAAALCKRTIQRIAYVKVYIHIIVIMDRTWLFLSVVTVINSPCFCVAEKPLPSELPCRGSVLFVTTRVAIGQLNEVM